MTAVEYVRARTVLLDALQALGTHRDAVVLVGAQAVYLHSGDADLATAPTTTDADLALSPDGLADRLPALEDAMTAAGFVPGAQPGMWLGGGEGAVRLRFGLGAPWWRALAPGLVAPGPPGRVARCPERRVRDMRHALKGAFGSLSVPNAPFEASRMSRTARDPGGVLPGLAARAEEGFDDPNILRMSMVVLVGEVLTVANTRLS